MTKLLGSLAAVALACGVASAQERECGTGGGPPASYTCTDLGTNSTTGEVWFDRDGPKYNCSWYAEGTRCQQSGDSFANFGLTANQACCDCRGGNETKESVEVKDICRDFTFDDGTEWFDSDGPAFNCKWYSVGSRCEDSGDSFANENKTADDVCCACDSGELLYPGVPEEAPSNKWGLVKRINERNHNTAFLSEGTRAALVLRRDQVFYVTGPDASFALQSQYVDGFNDVFTLESTWRRGRVRYSAITLPLELPIGRFDLLVNNKTLGTIVVLFNPWSRNDIVFMADQVAREEYIKAQTSRYYSGNVYGYPRSLAVTGSTWQLNTAQILDDVLDLLSYVPMNWEECEDGDPRTALNLSDPIKVARAMSYMGASGSSHGVVQGRWDGEYEDGKQPGYWTGTKQLMDAWRENGHRPVKYGQCWVFGCTLTSFMRTLGIPARVITNFNSAHDVPSGLMETPYGTEGKYDWVIDEETDDSVWNFHVWVNVWMSRPDLDEKNIGIVPHAAGWNDIDSTPQELSYDKFQLGPANHNDMKSNYAKGNQYDNRFVMGEYNAYHSERGAEYVGRYALTGLVNEPRSCAATMRISSRFDSNLRRCTNDITANHKPAEPSNPPLFNTTLDRRRRADGGYGLLMTDAEAYLAHEYHLSADEIKLGDDIVVTVDSHLETHDMRSVNVDLKIESIEYSGDVLGEVQVLRGLASLDATKLTVAIPFDVYKEAIRHALDFKITATIKSNDDEAADAQVEHLRISLEAPPPVVTVTEDNNVTVTWVNPLPVDITNVHYTIDGPGKGVVDEKVRVLAAGEVHSVTVEKVSCGAAGSQRHASIVAVAVTADSVAFQQLHAAAPLNCARVVSELREDDEFSELR